MSNFYAVVGRICGDDEDSILTLCADSREEAVNVFRQWLWDLDGSAPEAIAEMEAADQGGVRDPRSGVYSAHRVLPQRLTPSQKPVTRQGALPHFSESNHEQDRSNGRGLP